MKTILYICVCLGLFAGQVRAQQPDSVRVVKADSVRTNVRTISDSVQAIHEFLNAQGPAEAVFSFISPPPYQFRSGVYSVARLDFPLLNSPDSLVRQSLWRSYKQKRRARIALVSTIIPMGILMYSAAKVLATIGSFVAGRPRLYELPERNAIRATGFAVMVGTTLSVTFNIASIINSKKNIKRHNGFFGRGYPTIFNPKGL